MKNRNKITTFNAKWGIKGFTLVELIVVITILAILGTIAFISLQGYSKDARNSTRVSDIKTLEKMFSFYHLRESDFPAPTNGEQVTYSGAQVWTEGTFGEDARRQVGSKGNISNIPKDPLTLSEYTYSVLNTGQEYQLAAVFEGDLANNLNLANKSYAAGGLGSTYIKGNYNGQIVKTSTGGTEYVLAVPSIIRGITTETDLVNIINTKKLTFKGSHNTPSSYSGTTSFNDAAITGDIIKPNKLVVFSGDLNNLRGSSNSLERKTFLENLQQAYTGTLVSDIGSIESIIRLDITDTSATETLAIALVNNNLGGAITSSSGGGSTPSPVTDWRSIDPNCDIADITIGNQTWAGCNSTLGTGIEFVKNNTASCYNYTGIAGKPCSSSQTLSNAKENAWNSTYGINNIWGKLYTWDNSPSACTSGYHVPTDAEWTTLENTLAGTSCRTLDGWQCDPIGWKNHTTKNASNNIVEALRLPLAGAISSGGHTFYYRGHTTFLWSSTLDNSEVFGRDLSRNKSTLRKNSWSKAYGYSVRCIKD